MPTENPKISAYVPQVVYEKVKQFKEERKISLSQAAIEIFAEYFGINLEKSTIGTTGSLPARVSKLEELVEKFESMLMTVSDKVDQSVLLSKPLNVDQGVPLSIPLKEKAKEFAAPLENFLDKTNEPSDLPSELLSGLPTNTEDLGAKHSSVAFELNSDKNSEELRPEEVEISSIQSESESNLPVTGAETLLSEDLSFDLNGDVIYLDTPMLALRIKMAEPSLRAKKSQLKGESFYDWLSKRDPDGVRWVYVKKGKKGHYFAPSDLGQDIKDRIIKWIASTKDSNTKQE